jgi:hypothetical protein
MGLAVVVVVGGAVVVVVDDVVVVVVVVVVVLAASYAPERVHAVRPAATKSVAVTPVRMRAVEGKVVFVGRGSAARRTP